MKQFKKITSTCLTLRDENIDTDQIVPARFLKITTREGFGKYLFYDWRFDSTGKLKNKNRFNKLNNQTNIKILIAGNNFGCGSSREHAVWAISDYGFQAVISSSFGDIFYNNSLKNGLLPIILKPKEMDKLFRDIEHNPSQKVIIDLSEQKVICSSLSFTFAIDFFRKTCLLNGVDELGYILSKKIEIKEFETKYKMFITNS